MPAEAIVDLSTEAEESAKRLPMMIVATLFWAISAVSIGFTICYAYHIGI